MGWYNFEKGYNIYNITNYLCTIERGQEKSSTIPKGKFWKTMSEISVRSTTVGVGGTIQATRYLGTQEWYCMTR